MIKLRIYKILENVYYFHDINDNSYNLTIEFYDLDEMPKVNEYIFMDKSLLNPNYKGYSPVYAFAKIESNYGKKISLDNMENNIIDLIKIQKNDKNIYLKRLYG